MSKYLLSANLSYGNSAKHSKTLVGLQELLNFSLCGETCA